ncbi:ribosomal RNA-processing protein 7-domain-containing protein [Radiomyces spectabilis]|uniref:ribosomal RNA-processing protein 7-domain-containing protein n=1 Tax=Radiomyces spectabilis TaxID=64574 RepID=UPI0022210044|nr:ribosomal RNA-processing protein 7-domain-containing protein [Radiomyces spectabilis]KAI8393576.1 ribosomal RNA-processing protein 7-domain-containing protein [Radiomyces spectabilis]
MVKGKKQQAKTTSSKVVKPLDEFLGFKVLPVLVKENCRHYMYMKQHIARSSASDLPEDQTLFLVNLPADTTDQHLKHFFAPSKIAHIYYQGSLSSAQIEGQEPIPATHHTKQPRGKKRKALEAAIVNAKPTELRHLFSGGKSAHIVFESARDLNRVLEFTRIDRKWTLGEEKDTVQPLGFQRYVLAFELSRPDHESLQQNVDSFMMKFKANEYQKEREALERMNKMDEDGFVVVTRHKKVKTSDGTVNVLAGAAEPIIDPRKVNKKKELVDFYRFQLREKKQSELLDLRRRFEEDKAKIAQLKQSRKFKPF